MTVFFDQGIFQSIGMVYKIKPKAAFDAQMTKIGRRVYPPR